MKITNIRTRRGNGVITLLADAKIRPVGNDTVYFTFDEKHKGLLAHDASPFAAALLVPSMHFGEDLVIEGPISKKLYDGMAHIMETMAGWNVGLKRIQIRASAVVEDTFTPKNVAVFFSAGVDAFYSYLKHRNDAHDPITHLILIRGNDIEMENAALWEATLRNAQHVAAAGKVTLVTVTTNIQSLLEPMVAPDFTHGGWLGAVGLCLRAGIKNIYIPASFTADQDIKWGSRPDIDPYWNTETLTFEHDGTEANRLQKIERQVAASPLALDYLRVCHENINGKYNCGECEKCLRTMLNLYVIGKLGDAKTFPHTFNLDRVTYAIARSEPLVPEYKILLSALQKKNMDVPLQKAIEKGLMNPIDYRQGTKDRIFKAFFYFDHRYLRGVLLKLYKTIRQ